MNEFEIIQHFFSKQATHRKDVIIGIGDDAALVSIPPNKQMVITTDTLVNDVHFPIDAHAFDIGYKALAVNLSDLAAMGATPAWLTLSLTLPHIDKKWLEEFSRGFFVLATEFEAQLIGGDLTKGPLTITIQAQGLVNPGEAILRHTAKPGDLIYVTNTLGDAAAGLAYLQHKINLNSLSHEKFLTKLNRPFPQIKMGKQLVNIATAAIDISDGLIADLNHILEKSEVGAEIIVDHIPLSEDLCASMNQMDALNFALNGGDDYELCFTVPENKKNKVPKNCSCIGIITDTKKLDLQFSNGKKFVLNKMGYQHFK